MTRNAYLIIGLIFVFIIAGLVYIKQRGGSEVLAPTSEEVTTEAPPASQAETKTVTYTTSGFSPTSVTIKTGDTVVFKNTSGRDFWPASAIHPTHALYPEFDAKKSISSGGTYSFTFTRTGSWKYHNHLNPASTGTIVVQ